MENMPVPQDQKIDRPNDDEENGHSKRSYYYDDSHGYEDYDAESEGEIEDEESEFED